MAERINVTSKREERIVVTSTRERRIEPADFARLLGADPCGAPIAGPLDPIALGELGHQLIKRLRAAEGTPADASKLALNGQDVAALDEIGAAVERATGVKPSPGEIAGVILRHYLAALKTPAERLSPADVNRMIEDRLAPLREEVERLRKQLAR